MAKYQVVITDPAIFDLQDIVDYIAFEMREPVTARRQLERIRDIIFSLEEFPMRHPLVSDHALADKGYRMLTVDNCIVFYIASTAVETATIIRVLHSRRDWLSFL